MKIYGVPPSPFARKVVVILEEKNIPYEYVAFSPFPKTPELLAMNPKQQVPVLEHEGQFICDSSVICAYLEKTHPKNPMVALDPIGYARALFLEEYADTTLIQAVGPIFRQRYVNPNLFDEPCDEAIVAKTLAEDLPPVLDYLEGQVSPDAGICGAFGIADAAIGCMLDGLTLSGEKINADKWPKLAKYHASLAARPSFLSALPK